MTSPIRILRVTYTTPRHGQRRRRARVFVKVPYGGAFAMSELLTRMVSVGQVERFEVAAAAADEIGAFVWHEGRSQQRRKTLERWLPALTKTSEQTGVDWTL